MISYLSTSCYVAFPGQLFSNFLVATWCTGYYYYPALFTYLPKLELKFYAGSSPAFNVRGGGGGGGVEVAICVVQIFPKNNISPS